MISKIRCFSWLAFSIYMQSCHLKPKQENNIAKETKRAFSSYADSTKNEFICDLNKTFNFNSINEGIDDSLEIRIWPIQHVNSNPRCLDFKILKDSVYAGWVYYSLEKNLSFQSKKLIPLHGWKAFYDSIKAIGAMQLPDQDSIGDHPMIISGICVMEFATKNGYRRIGYIDYGSDEKHPECKKAIQFIYFLQKEFRENYWWPQPID